MFCPTIKDECRVAECRDWDSVTGDCHIIIEHKIRQEQASQTREMMDFMNVVSEGLRISSIQYKTLMTTLLDNPLVPDEDKGIIRKILEAPSSEVAQKLLDEFEEGRSLS